MTKLPWNLEEQKGSFTKCPVLKTLNLKFDFSLASLDSKEFDFCFKFSLYTFMEMYALTL